MSQNIDAKDKIILDPTDAEDIMEHFSRLNPGDEVSGTYKATLDEAGQKVVTLSIVEITVDKPEDEKSEAEGDGEPVPGQEGDDEEAEGETPAAVTVMKNENGVPEQEGNITPDSMPTH